MGGFVRCVFPGRVECKKFGQEFGLCNGQCTVRIVGQVKAQKTGCISVECDLVVFSHAGNDCVYVFRGVAENEYVIDIDDDVCGFCCDCPVEEAVVKCGHVVSFGKKDGFVVLIE